MDCLCQVKIISLQYHEILFWGLLCQFENKFPWHRRWDCLCLDLVDDFHELDWESWLTGFCFLVGLPVGVVAVTLVI